MSNGITKEQSRELTDEIMEAVNAILAARGMEATTKKYVYGAYYEIKIQAVSAEIGDSGINENTPEAKAYLQIGHLYGLNDGALGTKFRVSGQTYTFIGLSTRSPKYPILAKMEDGRTVKFTEAAAAYINSALASV